MPGVNNSPYREPPRRPLFAVVVTSIIAGILITGSVAYFGWKFLERLDPKKAIDTTAALELAKFSLTVTAGLGAVIALVVAYRRQRVDEAAHHLAEMAANRDRIRLLSERFSTASNLLGNPEAAARLAGVYAMATLADEWDEERQSCVDVLCAYLRLPYDVSTPDRAERQVRFAIYSVLRNHLSSAAPVSWQNLFFDLSDADLCEGSLAGVTLVEGSLSLANSSVTSPGFSLKGAAFHGATVDISGIKVISGSLSFTDAIFKDSTLDARSSRVFPDGTIDISGARIFGTSRLQFNDMRLDGGHLNFDRSRILWDRDIDMRPYAPNISMEGSKFDGGQCSFRKVEVEPWRSDLDFLAPLIDLTAVDSANSIISFKEFVLPDREIRLNSIKIDGGKLGLERMKIKEGNIDLSGSTLRDGWVSFDGTEFSPSGGTDDNIIIPPWLRDVHAMSREERREVGYLSLRHPRAFLEFSGAVLVGGNITFEYIDATYGKIDFVGCELRSTSIWVTGFSIGAAVWDFWCSEFSGGLFVFQIPCNMTFLIDTVEFARSSPFAVFERQFPQNPDSLRPVGGLEEVSRRVYVISRSEI